MPKNRDKRDVSWQPVGVAKVALFFVQGQKRVNQEFHFGGEPFTAVDLAGLFDTIR